MEKPSNQVMVVDCQLSGISGDMIIAALLGVGASESRVVNAIESVKDHVDWCRRIDVNIKDVAKKEIKAKQVDIEIDEDPLEIGEGRSASSVKRAVSESIRGLELSDDARNFALRTVDTLFEAEMKVHGKVDVSEVELGELGSTDTVADIVGAAAALDDLHVFPSMAVYCTPVAVGGGLFKFSHGVFQSPGPVTLEILRGSGFPIIGGPVEAELATPTGASILVNIVNKEVSRLYPNFRPRAIGYGAGRRDFVEVPNILRIVIGDQIDHGLLTDGVYVLETNLDDVSGEIIGFLMERLISEGVRDVCVVPVMMKKSRPGQILKVIVDEGEVERISRMIIDETGTLGVRSYPVKRFVLSREVEPVEVQIGNIVRNVRVKVARSNDGRILNLKPEYEDVRSISIEIGRPFREVERIVMEEAKKKSQNSVEEK